MINLSFPTRKLGEDIVRINRKLKDVDEVVQKTVLGVTNTKGITITGNKASEDLSKYIVIKGEQFAYNPYRINVGSIGLTKDNQEGLVSPAYIVFKTKETLVPEFLLFYLKSSIGLNLIQWYGNRGGVRDALRFNDLCKIDIPDLTIKQQLIALEKIRLFEEKLIFLNTEIDKQGKLLKKYKSSILNDAIQGKLVEQCSENGETASFLIEKIKEEKERLRKNKIIKKEKPLSPVMCEEKQFEIPIGWEWAKLGDIALKIVDGTHHSPKSFVNGDYLYITAKNIKYEGIDTSNVTYVPKEVHGEIYSRCNVEKGDILLIKDGATTGIVTINQLEQEFSLLSSVGLIKTLNNYINNQYLVYCIRSPYLQNQINELMKGSAITRITIQKIKNFVLPIPPLEEQRLIVEKISKLMEYCDELEGNIAYSKQEAEKLMKVVLQEALQEAFSVKEETLN